MGGFDALAVAALICLFSVANGASDGPRLAVIGAGIGGAFSAYHLRHLNASKFDVFEASEIVGGRTREFTLNGQSM
eukprot:CAMPEP_0202907532 /NCGR_PEP_ID=MMETSP1392-20130828/42942_1 /ASSEMBLY_ACC=CAM_ASM_000868 /TAXON_ID=225041 /ORGANISM="Chlamydomonas chlamydogama, Strain SAG 11-48b" /LENGTH=75 /DNA_ID=CAMNT_0049596477 /DNA_START=41 /DNA_END=265 /DNA_ORIENTATION=+